MREASDRGVGTRRHMMSDDKKDLKPKNKFNNKIMCQVEAVSHLRYVISQNWFWADSSGYIPSSVTSCHKNNTCLEC